MSKAEVLLLDIVTIAICVYFLFGCASQPKSANIIRHQVTLEEIKEICYRSPHGILNNNIGCAYYTNSNGGTCNIYVPKQSEYDKLRSLSVSYSKANDISIELYILGHEVKHCFEGAWH